MHSIDFTPAAIAAWCDPEQKTAMSFDAAVHAFHSFGPRVRFLKSLPFAASMLDAGAGDGSTIILRDWPEPKRADVRMFAWAGERGSMFDRFAGSEVGYWPAQPPHFDGMQFDAVFSANFIEHIDNPFDFIRRAADKTNKPGRIFLKWPRMQSIDLPSKIELAKVGVNVMTARYHDDTTHRPLPPTTEQVVDTLASCGFSVVESGISRVSFIDKQLAIYARRTANIVDMTLAYWSYTGFAQYIIATNDGL